MLLAPTVLSLCQSMKDDLAAPLDPETGFAPRLKQICHDQLISYEDNPDIRTSHEELELLRMEQRTWGLLQAVLPARKTDPPPLPSACELLAENPYTPTSTLSQAIINASPLLTELIVVREWLQETTPALLRPESTTGYWKFMKYCVMQSLRTGMGHRDGLVKEMDPDAVNRDRAGGRGLAADDMNYDKSLVQGTIRPRRQA